MVLNLRRLVFTAILMYCVAPAMAQVKHHPVNAERKDFYQLLNDANIKFTFPAGFRQIPAVNDEDFSFDFDMETPGNDFEIWLMVKSQKQNYNSFLHTRHDASAQVADPDSMYLELGKATAIALTGGTGILERNIPPTVLARYNADAGRSYLLSLLDLADTKHYKYALIISLQQSHTGMLVAVCFTNNKDADFYNNMNRACRSFKFKPATTN